VHAVKPRTFEKKKNNTAQTDIFVVTYIMLSYTYSNNIEHKRAEPQDYIKALYFRFHDGRCC